MSKFIRIFLLAAAFAYMPCKIVQGQVFGGGLSKFDSPTLNPRLKFDLPLFDFPYQADAANRPGGSFWSAYGSPSMSQSLAVTTNLNSAFALGMNELAKKHANHRYFSYLNYAGAFLVSGFALVWLHEEYHRSIYTRHGINSDITYLVNLNELSVGGYVSVTDLSRENTDNLRRLIRKHPSELIRVGTSGLESHILLTENLQSLSFFYNQEYIRYSAYISAV